MRTDQVGQGESRGRLRADADPDRIDCADRDRTGHIGGAVAAVDLDLGKDEVEVGVHRLEAVSSRCRPGEV